MLAPGRKPPARQTSLAPRSLRRWRPVEDGRLREQEEVEVMDMNEYMLELARDRQAELWEAAERSHRVQPAHPMTHTLRVVLGRALVRIGRRLKGVNTSSVGKRGAGGAIDTRRRPTCGAVRG